MATEILSLQHVTIRNQQQVIFNDLSFSIQQGEHWALTGPSGSGKSALLAAIAGRLLITRGTTSYPFFEEWQQQHPGDHALMNHYKLIAEVSSRHHFRNLSNTGQFYYQQRFNSSDSEDAPTVEKYLHQLPAYAPSAAWTYEKVTERLQLLPLLQKPLILLSNGETKRVLIAAALLRNPVLLLLDNPLSGLDQQMRLYFHQLIQEIIQSGITILIATSPKEIPDSITHVAELENGSIRQQCPRAQYQPAEHLQPAVTGPDEAILQELLSNETMPVFDNIVSMQDVVIRYGDKVVLDHINWTIKQGERWALLGHNGAGKSTLLSLINGDNPQAYANHIVLFDQKRGSGESIWDIKRKTGFVSPELFQYFDTGTSCLQVIESGFYDTLGLFRPSTPAKAAVCMRWMELLHIAPYARKLFKNTPASVQRLCLLARALVKHPPLLIFDEPCQGLDAEQQAWFKQVVESICAHSRTTLIYVTHYQDEIPACVTQSLRLEKGKAV